MAPILRTTRRPATEAVESLVKRVAPRPTCVALALFPAMLRLPDGTRVAVGKVFYTPQGLYVYDRAPKNRDDASSVADFDPDGLFLSNIRFWSKIHYDDTPRPVTGHAAVNTGHRVVTDAGVVQVQKLVGCGCSHGTLKRWSPRWAARRIAWEDLRS